MEAELFGTEAGAFTGAKARTGRFEAADGGTIFLDELGNLSAQGQAKLLRVLQTGEYERLGSNVTRRTKARIIAATNANLPQLIRDGKFREDLFYRLNVIELEVPPLSARQEDILPLARHFLEPGFTLSQDRQVARAAGLARAGGRLARRPRGDRAGAAARRRRRRTRRPRPRLVAPGALPPHGEAGPQDAGRPGPHHPQRIGGCRRGNPCTTLPPGSTGGPE
jgi:sigma54-dependent transcription regulator